MLEPFDVDALAQAVHGRLGHRRDREGKQGHRASRSGTQAAIVVVFVRDVACNVIRSFEVGVRQRENTKLELLDQRATRAR